MILDGEGRVLLVRHVPEHRSHWQGKWICPGGRLKPGEEIKTAILREVREETALEVELVRSLEPYEGIVWNGSELALHVVYITYLAQLVGGDLKPGSDVGEAVWVAPPDLPALNDELHPDTRRLLNIAGLLERSWS